jgi:hypothetical protein
MSNQENPESPTRQGPTEQDIANRSRELDEREARLKERVGRIPGSYCAVGGLRRRGEDLRAHFAYTGKDPAGLRIHDAARVFADTICQVATDRPVGTALGAIDVVLGELGYQ